MAANQLAWKNRQSCPDNCRVFSRFPETSDCSENSFMFAPFSHFRSEFHMATGQSWPLLVSVGQLWPCSTGVLPQLARFCSTVLGSSQTLIKYCQSWSNSCRLRPKSGHVFLNPPDLVKQRDRSRYFQKSSERQLRFSDAFRYILMCFRYFQACSETVRDVQRTLIHS